ncbi:MAG: hypothetical protein B7Y56_07870 [Gallionellales bacterium 35-53-114]|jgi:diacylglycerol kinase|nr:MAG: hypothetical protein B7Y56_07870 [Gallionellales bacterium 35-53-114]OYZ63220.1 MAG: hypothetical protein B7Y04_10050 [Gallionellales bacterium 24-53-125]OZB08686.1 MAG: hypothetical protein B7X61_09140 [Gallionellales bacterium 39-52-133]HQS57455.1 diacylglycerol kinase family protein [Gallionellaceae bacterium]HQS74357.1 diacylglycerol kinase family protein [Gallionellaceae bacterium]
MSHFLYSIRCAFRGIAYALAAERNLKIQLLVFVLVLLAGWVLEIDRIEFLLILLVSALVFSLELINTALERLADKVSPQYDLQIGVIKDVMAGAVLVASLFALLMGCVIFFDPLCKLLQFS